MQHVRKPRRRRGDREARHHDRERVKRRQRRLQLACQPQQRWRRPTARRQRHVHKAKQSAQLRLGGASVKRRAVCCAAVSAAAAASQVVRRQVGQQRLDGAAVEQLKYRHARAVERAKKLAQRVGVRRPARQRRRQPTHSHQAVGLQCRRAAAVIVRAPELGRARRQRGGQALLARILRRRRRLGWRRRRSRVGPGSSCCACILLLASVLAATRVAALLLGRRLFLFLGGHVLSGGLVLGSSFVLVAALGAAVVLAGVLAAAFV
eukprot:32725-Chlamydomonas_euryale.AAC.2